MGKLNKPRGRVGAGFTRTESTKTVDGRKLLGNVELSRAITRAGVPRGVAVASIARLPSSTDDPSGSTADRHLHPPDAMVAIGLLSGEQEALLRHADCSKSSPVKDADSNQAVV